MSNTKSILFKYLSKEQIFVNQKEFDYQFSSHPDYPSLLAISDTLSFFNINNAAIKVSNEKFDLLPNNFLAYLRDDNDNFLSLISKEDKTISYTTSGKDTREKGISEEQFFEKWDEIVLLAEEDNVFIQSKPKNNVMFFILLLVLLITILLYQNIINYWFLIFAIMPVFGIFFSIGALSDVFNTDNSVFSKFCEGGSSSSCSSVINSSKWSIFSKISFSDLSIVFFSAQLLALMLFGLLNKYEQFYLIQTILLFFSAPVILMSLYYQKFVEKKWCKICLSIIFIILIELLCTLFLVDDSKFSISAFSVLLFSFSVLLPYNVWFPLKRVLSSNKNLKESELKANRFKRNYQLFKNTLLTEKKNDLPKSLLTIGNPEAKIKIAILTSPFCGFCKAPHNMLKSMVEKYDKEIEVSIIFNVADSNEDFKVIAKNLIQLRLNSDVEVYYEAMNYWYEVSDLDKWLLKYENNTIDDRIDHSLDNQHLWCSKNRYNFTPCLFVNGRKYSDIYENSDLQFFIDELKEDLEL